MASLKRSLVNSWPKLLTHEHLDCSLRPATVLDLANDLGFAQFTDLPFPADIISSWQRRGLLKRQRQQVAARYQHFIAKHASSSLANYVNAIGHHVLPVMQTEDNLFRVTQERIEDAVADGVIGMELRFAPQLHLRQGLKMPQVMDAVVAAVEQSPIPVKLIVCALRHENGRMARRLADLSIRYREHVGKFDLAGDEAANPGVLKWWLKQALRARHHGVEPVLHLWETNEPTKEDVRLLDEHQIQVLAHGFRGPHQGRRVCGICLTSNLVTGQIGKLSEHPADRLHREGKLITVETDGTLFTMTDATREYLLWNRVFGWQAADFLGANLIALRYSSFSDEDKNRIERRLRQGYNSAA